MFSRKLMVFSTLVAAENFRVEDITQGKYVQ